MGNHTTIDLLVKADPAKNFFVTMLVKDITLRDAIGDLVDNSVDAIKAVCENDDNLEQYRVDIELSKDKFSITDNGSGMSVQVARETAFNFGKANSHELIRNSIGQFGIGMKRAFFKIGNFIEVKSVERKSKFDLEIDVNDWLVEKEWNYMFSADTLVENTELEEATGFEVFISELTEEARSHFGESWFCDLLMKEIRTEHMLNINKGLQISINGKQLKATDIKLISNEKIKPVYWEKNEEKRSVRILAGISEADSDDGGWYVFCNERLVLAKNTTDQTVWTGRRGDGVPLWHAQYYRFRGYVFFEAEDSSDLPWNTTKTGMDLDSSYYQEVRKKMIQLTKQVIVLLDKLKDERSNENPEQNQELNLFINNSSNDRKPVLNVLLNKDEYKRTFVFPKELFSPVESTDLVKITYKVKKSEYEDVRKELGVKSAKQVGERTFKYYHENEV